MSTQETDFRELFKRSLVKIAELKNELAARGGTEPIALIGMALRAPGGCTHPEEFWQLLARGVDTIGPVPPSRWSMDGEASSAGTPAQSATRWGAFLQDDVTRFDAPFFSIVKGEAQLMDPQQRLVLELAWEALENAGQSLERAQRSRTGVFLGVTTHDYADLLAMEGLAAQSVHSLTGTDSSFMAGRLSYALGLDGPSMPVNTACSSSLVAVHLACQSLRNREGDLALAGGVNLMLSSMTTATMAKLGALSPEGRCKTFDAGANGFVRGEGCGIVVLKRLEDALRDGDPILALLRGSAVNQDGRSAGLTAPNVKSQQALLRQALDSAGLSPEQIGYVELHGTGTPLGDPIEYDALRAVLGQPRADNSPCVLGAVKTNIGHLEAAAGVMGLIKTVLCLRHEAIPPNLHLQKLNPRIRLEGTPFVLPGQTLPWVRNGTPRRAGVSSFGIGGTNAHVIVEEAPRPAQVRTARAASSHVLPVSARSAQALVQGARDYADWLQRCEAELGDLAYTASVRRSHHKYRLAVVGASKQELARSLRKAAQEFEGAMAAPSRTPRLVFVFSGQGTQWEGMGAEWMRQEGAFATALRKWDRLLKPHTGFSIIEEMARQEQDTRLEQTQVAQAASFATQVALVEVLASWGIEAEVVLGHSVGEVAAAYVAGVLEAEEAARLCALRGRVMRRVAPGGWMVEVACSEAEARQALEGAAAELVREAGRIAARQTQRTMVSTVTGQKVLGPELDARYWGANVRDSVRFEDAVKGVLEQGNAVFVEIGPSPALTRSLQEEVGARGGRAVETLSRGRDALRSLQEAAAELYAQGYAVDFAAMYEEPGRVVELPRYPWQKERFWMQGAPSHMRASGERKRMVHPLLGEALPRSSLHPNERAWNLSASLESVPYLGAHRLHGEAVFPGAGYIEMALAACKQRWPERTVLLEEVSFERVLVLTSESEQQVQVALVEESPDRATVSIASQLKSDWLRHASARVRLAEEQEEHGLPALDELRRRIVLPHPVATHYQQMRAKGLEHGPAFQGVRELWTGPGEALGQVRLAAELDATGYTVHPACLDACLQVTLAALTREDTADENWLPVGANSVRIRQPLGEVAWSYVKLRAMDESQPDHRFAQIIAFDESEQVCVELSLELMRVAPLLPRLSEEIGLLARIRAAPAEERRELLVDFLRQGAARILRVAPEQIDGTTLLVDLGIDSFSGIEVQQQLETHLGLKLPAILLWQQLNLIELAEEIDRRLSSGDTNAAAVPLIEPNVDLLADATLDPNFPTITASVEPKRVAHPSLLLLTGSTGFLGSFLLHELLTQTEASIVCLVRARDTEQARARIEGSLRGQGLWSEQYAARIRPIVGDLALEHLGLGEPAFASLAAELDGIIHNAAPVHWIHPYSHLRKTIVAGTLELLRMAALGRPVPFHFVSTVGASMQFRGYSGLTRRPGGETQDEVMNEDYMRRRWFHMGYLQAKWVADELVGQAQQRGLPASIYRMSFITGHSADGRWHKQNRDFICHLIRGCCALGAAPLQDMVFDMVPVDCVSRSLVELALSPPALGRGFQMTSLAPMHWHQMVETLREAGYTIELLEPRAWIERIREQGLRGRARDLYAMLPHFESCPMERLLGGYEPFRETPRLMTQQSTLRYLKDAQSWSPIVDRRVFRLYLDALVASGFMPPPEKPPSSE